MSDLLPLFPLPNVVLFPNVFLPLHIFEPRYREMVADAVASDRMIGMVLLRPGWDRDYEGRPPIYPIGCRPLAGDDPVTVRRCRSKLESLLAPAVGDLRDPQVGSSRSRAADAKIPPAMSDEDLVNALAQYLDLEPLEKQALLEQPSLRTRAESLVELLEMKIMMARTPGVSNVAH